MKKTLSTKYELGESNTEIKIKSQSIQWWKPTLDVSDFYLSPYTSKYQLLDVVDYNPPRGDSKNVSIKIKYFDIEQDKQLEKNINFSLKNSENESLLYVISKDNFKINNSIFNSLNFKNFSKKYVITLNKNIKINKAKIHSWNLLEKTIVFELDVNVLKTNTSVLLEYKLDVDFDDLVVTLLIFDAKNNHFILQDDDNNLQFKPVKIHAKLAPNATKIFVNNDINKIDKLIDKLTIIDAKLMVHKVDVVNKKNLGNFNCSIKINDHIFEDIIISATYDATTIQKKMVQLIQELPIIEKIKGYPRNKLKLPDIFENWNELYIHKSLAKKGVYNFFEDYIALNVSDIDFVKKIAVLEAKFNFGDKIVLIFSKKINFEKTPFNELIRSNKKELIEIKDKQNLMRDARWNLVSKHFTILDKRFRVYAAKSLEPINIAKNNVDYEFKIRFNKNVIFTYKQKIHFGYSQKAYLFKNMNALNWNFNYFAKQNINYFQEKINNLDFDMEWISLSKKEISNVLPNKKYKNCDFVITNCFFKKMDFSKDTTLLIKFIVASPSLKTIKNFKTFIKLNNSKILEKFDELNAEHIKLANKHMLSSYPIPLLDVKDFQIIKPFVINYVSIQYSEKNLSINCVFKVSYLEKNKTIEKTLYFANAYNEKESDAHYSEVMNQIDVEQINVIYNPKIKTYYKYQTIKFRTPLEYIFVELDNWKLQNRRGKVLLNLLVRYKNQTKKLSKYIKYDHRLSRKAYHEWKEANYAK